MATLLLIAILSATTDSQPGTTADPCAKHIELHDAEFWAKELGQAVPVVLRNHRINLWAGPSPKKGKKVGEMRVGSRAQILEEGGEDYKVRSPLDGSVGWVGKIQVERTLHQTVKSRTPCTP